ncbi:GDP-fucose synthetase [Desulfocucumis palustris]|uniref:GDP-fucose synthetase n=1 Tax=Desulfocucumis palustris TaxID=1898651 RepID=A0A2L2XB57_9FIRM|nr:GDP-fucose synthetase [Desulfocucumis palustris]
MSEKVINSFYKKNVLVTGGTGMIGRQVVKILCDAGAAVKVASLDGFSVDRRAEHVFGDLCNLDFCLDLTKDMEFVFHMAGVGASAQTTMKKPASHSVPTLMVNTNVLEASRRNNVQRLVYTSSVGAYANAEILKESQGRELPPMDFYAGWAKRMAEYQIKAYKAQYGIDSYAVVRLSNVYGPGDNFHPANSLVIPSLIYRLYNNENPLAVYGDGSEIRDFVYSKDAAEGVILALYHGTGADFVNIGGIKGCSIKEVVETLKLFIDFEYVFDTTKPRGYPKRVLDSSLAIRRLGYSPSVSLEEGLRLTWDWFVNNPGDYLLKQNYF